MSVVVKKTKKAALSYGKNVLKLNMDLYEARWSDEHKGYTLHWVGSKK